MNAFVHQEAFGGSADLAGEMKCGRHGARNGDFERRLVGDDEGIVATRLDEAGLQMRTASGCDGARGRDRSSKRDDMGAGALDQCLAHGGSAGEKVHDTQGQASKMLHEFQRVEATSFGGLHNRHISRGKGGPRASRPSAGSGNCRGTMCTLTP